MAEITFGQVCRSKRGEDFCGDAVLIHSFERIKRLCVIDGLGHGLEAQLAAQAAQAALSVEERLLPKLIQSCHRKLIGTRGAVIGIVDLDLEKKLWRGIAVGNISIAFYGKDHFTPFSNGGIAGYSLPSSLASWSRPYSEGQILIVNSDGIGPLTDLAKLLSPDGGLGLTAAQDLAESIAMKYGKIEDDQAILVAK